MGEMMKVDFSLEDIKCRITKDSNNISNYSNVSIEEMDWLVEQTEKYQKIEKAWFDSIKNNEDVITFLGKCKEVIESCEIPKSKRRS